MNSIEANRLSLQRTPGRGGEVALLRAPRASDLMRRDSWQFFANPRSDRTKLFLSQILAH